MIANFKIWDIFMIFTDPKNPNLNLDLMDYGCEIHLVSVSK